MAKLAKYISDVNLFYAHAALFAFAEIIFVFSLPVLLWNQGFSLSFIFLFFALAALPGYFFTKNIVRYMRKTGIKMMLFLGVILYVVLGFVAPLLSMENYYWVLLFILVALQALTYFPARHLYFSEILSDKKIGVQSGILSASMVIARTLGPIVAGSIAVFSQFDYVFTFGALILLISMLPIFLLRTEVEMDFNDEDFEKMSDKNPIFKSTKLAYIGDGMNGFISYILWPLLFLLVLSDNDFFEFGSLMTITYAISALIMVVVGHFFDKKHRKKLLGLSVFSNIIAAFGRFSLIFFHPWLFVYAVQSFYSFSESALQSTFEAYWYSYSKKTNTIFFTIHREENFALGRFVGGVILALAAFYWPLAHNLWFLFLLSVPLVFLYLRKGHVDHHL